MPPEQKKRLLTGLFFALCLFIADQISKHLIFDLIQNPPRQIVLTSFFNLTPVWNRGVSFGMFKAGDETQVYALILVALVISSVVFAWLLKAPDRSHALCYGAIIGGALGNVVDRLRFHAVFDFFDFHIGGWHYPAFNIADASIVCGVAVLLLLTFREQKRHKTVKGD
ncbi:MAG: signal peptidase II [Alphaproteobacteria bacterium]|jgi:signal peptidase II|nr:signal peptidase II [Thalassospira sp.]MCE2964645.1 signal peptidase II [Alphaproteobacteria bacterium]